MISTLALSNSSDASDASLFCKVMVFPIAGYLFALPMIAIQRVAMTPPLLNLNPQGVNLLHVGGYEIAVVDLYAHLASVQTPNRQDGSSQSHGKFMVIAQSKQGNEIGILVDQLPTVMDLPYSTIQPFPKEYRQTTPLGIARYMATLMMDEEQQTIFILDMTLNS